MNDCEICKQILFYFNMILKVVQHYLHYMDVSIKVSRGVMFLVICNPTIKNIVILSYVLLMQMLETGVT